MEAAEKIPKKLYVYLDTTRGPYYRHGGENVHCGRAGHHFRDTCLGDLRCDPDVFTIKEAPGSPGLLFGISYVKIVNFL